jgi:hypothetical protein
MPAVWTRSRGNDRTPESEPAVGPHCGVGVKEAPFENVIVVLRFVSLFALIRRTLAIIKLKTRSGRASGTLV